jgi:hypothetical protein
VDSRVRAVECGTSFCESMNRSKRALLVLALLALFAMPVAEAIAQCPGDRDCDGLPDAEEDYLASGFLPTIWADQEDNCGPNWPGQWCIDGNLKDRHLQGFLGYDVVELGFSNLFTIEYSLFLDFDCGIHTLYGHEYDVEGFTVLVQQTGSGFDVLSVETFGHHGSTSEQVDRYYPHEIYKFWVDGVLMSKHKHAMYVHKKICERTLHGNEHCERHIPLVMGAPGDTEIGSCVLRPLGYPTPLCPCGTDVSCMLANIDNPDCWSELMYRSGPFVLDCKMYREKKDLHADRKQLPPWLPMGISLPENVPYVDVYEETDFTAEAGHLTQRERDNFGNVLIDRGMPFRFICWPHYAYWREYYDPVRQSQIDYDIRGLHRDCFEYKYWDTESYLDETENEYVNDIESLKLHGLPGTVLSLFKYTGPYDNVPERICSVMIQDGMREIQIRDLDEYSPGLSNTIDYICWGFGPTADAGNDQVSECRSTVTLDARGSYEFALDEATLAETFGLQDFDYENDWEYRWYDETNGDRLLGTSAVVTTDDLEVGGHRMKLEVKGTLYVVPQNATFAGDPLPPILFTVADWCSVYVDIGAPVGTVRGVVKGTEGGRYGVRVVATSNDGCSAHQERYRDHSQRSACTDENGFFRLDSLCVGQHDVRIITPLGFAAKAERQSAEIEYTCWPQPVDVTFELEPIDVAPAPRSMGYWRHVAETCIRGKSSPLVSPADLSGYLDLIRIHFNESCAGPVTIFTVPQPASQADSLDALLQILTVNGGRRMNDRARQQLMALMMNVVSLKIHQDYPVSEDGATVSRAINFCNQLICDSDGDNDEVAKDIADRVNNGLMVPSATIPLSEPPVSYAEKSITPGEGKTSVDESARLENYPNPFNASTRVVFSVDRPGKVMIRIYDAAGRSVRTLLDTWREPGVYSEVWDGRDDSGRQLSPGVYFYRLLSGGSAVTKRMVLLR